MINPIKPNYAGEYRTPGGSRCEPPDVEPDEECEDADDAWDDCRDEDDVDFWDK